MQESLILNAYLSKHCIVNFSTLYSALVSTNFMVPHNFVSIISLFSRAFISFYKLELQNYFILQEEEEEEEEEQEEEEEEEEEQEEEEEEQEEEDSA